MTQGGFYAIKVEMTMGGNYPEKSFVHIHKAP